jgi:hypothetical protein
MRTMVALLMLGLGMSLALVGTTTAEDKKGPPSGDKKKAGPTVTGKVKAINATSITLEGRTREDKQVAPPQTFNLAKNVTVTEGAIAKTLADVKAGATVTLTLSGDRNLVTAIALPAKGKERE